MLILLPGNLNVSTFEMITGDDDVDPNVDDKDMDVAGDVVGDEDDVEEDDDNQFTCLACKPHRVHYTQLAQWPPPVILVQPLWPHQENQKSADDDCHQLYKYLHAEVIEKFVTFKFYQLLDLYLFINYIY